MYSIDYGGNKIDFEIQRKKVKNINLTVRPNLEVMVSANHEVPLDYIKEFIYSKANWIESRLSYYEKNKKIDQGEKVYINGESFRYLGRQYRLKVFESADEGVKYYRGYIHLYVKDLNDTKRKEGLIDQWYGARSEIVFHDSLQRMHKQVKAYDIEIPQLDIRQMKSRWGSCYPDEKRIILNRSLIKAPRDCIDYVVLHELIHFKFEKHDGDFFRLLDILMPDWQGKKKMLDEVVVREL